MSSSENSTSGPPSGPGKVRWRRFAVFLIPALAAVAALMVLTAEGTLAASFSVSGQQFQVSADSLGGAELLILPLPMSSSGLIIHIGIGGVAGILIGAVLILCALLPWFDPAHRAFYFVVAVLLAIAALIASNLLEFIDKLTPLIPVPMTGVVTDQPFTGACSFQASRLQITG